jgi:hypothetical protein
MRLVPDPGKFPLGEKMDVHYNHPGEQVDVAVQVEDREWYLFNNENYLHPGWRHTERQLPPGEYVVRIQVFYESGRAEHWRSLAVPGAAQARSTSGSGGGD